ncbi:jg2465, partial [Pararge aegeria aegeria]
MDTVKCRNCNIVINEVLSFVQNKIDVMNNVSLALICRQSFEEDEIFKAKCLLFESLPHRLIKRKGEDRKQKNIDDIIGVLRGTEPDDIPV